MDFFPPKFTSYIAEESKGASFVKLPNSSFSCDAIRTDMLASLSQPTAESPELKDITQSCQLTVERLRINDLASLYLGFLHL